MVCANSGAEVSAIDAPSETSTPDVPHAGHRASNAGGDNDKILEQQDTI